MTGSTEEEQGFSFINKLKQKKFNISRTSSGAYQQKQKDSFSTDESSEPPGVPVFLSRFFKKEVYEEPFSNRNRRMDITLTSYGLYR